MEEPVDKLRNGEEDIRREEGEVTRAEDDDDVQEGGGIKAVRPPMESTVERRRTRFR